SHTLQVALPNGSTAEVQVVPKDVLATEAETHPNYVEGRKAEIAGRAEDAQAAMAANRQIHDRAMAEFNQRSAAAGRKSTAPKVTEVPTSSLALDPQRFQYK